MGILKITPFATGASTSGISISQGLSKGAPYIRIGLSSAAQTEYFGGSIDIKTHGIALTLTDDHLHHHLMGIRIVALDDAEALELSGSVHGSLGVRVTPWRPTEGKRPAASLPVINSQVAGGGVSVKLPEWARPVAARKSANA